MALRAQEISQEAGSKIAQAMKDVINAAAGLAGFAVESARDVVQYMVRRGQMTQEEADRIIREAEEAYTKRKPAAKAAAGKKAAPASPIPSSPATAAPSAAPAAKLAPRAAHPVKPAKKSVPKKKAASGSARVKPTTARAAGKKKKK